jgi:hypothetical protein
MINAKLFNPATHPHYVKEHFDFALEESGAANLDRPLIAQFCANDIHELLRGATLLADKGVCDAVDLNLGCPQGIAKKGHYGAFLMEDWPLIESLSALALQRESSLTFVQSITFTSICQYRSRPSFESTTRSSRRFNTPRCSKEPERRS